MDPDAPLPGARIDVGMIVSHAHKYVFLKTRKTAGTSIEIALSESCGPDDIITRLDEEDEATRRTLGFRGAQRHGGTLLRRAAGRLAREAGITPRQQPPTYFYNHMPASEVRRRLGEDIWQGYFKFTVERDPFDKAVSRYYWGTRDGDRPPISEYLASLDPELLSNWSIYAIGDEIAVDFVIRYEHLEADLTAAMERIGIDRDLHLPRAKGEWRTDRRHYSEVLDQPSRRLIERVCAKECLHFGYHWAEA